MLYRHTAERSLEVDVQNCFAQTGSIHPRIGFAVKIQNPFDFNLTFLQASGEVSVKTPKGPVHLGVPYFISQSTPFRPVNLYSLRDTQATLILDLDWRKLEYIEDHRDGDLILTGGLHGLCACLAIHQKGSDEAIDSVMWISGEIRRGNRREFPIYQTEWIRILGDLGYGRRRLIEIVLPSTEDVSQEILGHIEVADRSMYQGEYDSVLVSCRKALEAMDRASAEDGVDLVKRLGSESKAEHVNAIRKRLKDFLSKGAHTGSTIARRDADFALLLTKTLLAYVSSAPYSRPD